MTQLGANVEGLERIADRMGTTAARADEIRLTVGQMADDLQFNGRHGNAFRAYLHGPASQSLNQVSEALRSFATVAQAHARAQRGVSDGTDLPTYTGQVADPQPRIGDRTAPTEAGAVGAMGAQIERDTPAFAGLVRNDNAAIVFKDEEGTGADRMMTPAMSQRMDTLAAAVQREWPGQSLRVTEAWDEDGEHGRQTGRSLHYEGRAADITISDLDRSKLPRLYELARESGFGWVYYEDSRHVHVSVSR